MSGIRSCPHQPDNYMATWKNPQSGHWHILEYVAVRRMVMNDIKSDQCMRGVECCTDHRPLRAEASLVIKKKMRKSGSKVTKRLDASQTACAKKLERLQSTVQAIDVAEATGPFGTLTRATYDAAVDFLLDLSAVSTDTGSQITRN